MSEKVDRVAKAILDRIGHQDGCYGEACGCFGAAAVLYCKLGVTADDLALAVVEALREDKRSETVG